MSSLKLLSIHNPKRLGKCASLNRAFEAVEAQFYLVVDSDDRLSVNAVSLVKAKADRYNAARNLGAVFLSYADANGTSLGRPPSTGDLAMTRAAYDAAFQKYDGAVGYFHRTVARYRYPEYHDETYAGPTILQLRMAPQFEVCFTDTVIGVAEYQLGGLTARGRRLRLRNPLGVMEYSLAASCTG